ncbi:uncharacterized protein [Temnothorax longispinosus]|uniref:uncharacterized protein n=1 Tax=Temnothorax longispinosus TaxID=300112 RepID=UPI003A993001
MNRPIRWTKEEQEAALQGFAEYMEGGKLPSLRDIQEIREKYECLSKHSSLQIKSWVHYKQKAVRKLASPPSPYRKTKRIRWTEEEQEAALQGFAEYMEEGKLPSLRDIQEVRQEYKCLSKRSSAQIKTWLYNKQKAVRKLALHNSN